MNRLLVRLTRFDDHQSPLTFGCAENLPAVLSIFACIGAWRSFRSRCETFFLPPHNQTMINMIDGLLTPDLNDLTYHSDT